MKHPFLPARLTVALLAVLPATGAHADVVTQWNALAITATKTGLDGTSGPKLNSNLASRVHAIEAIAVYDAVNAIRHTGRPYLFKPVDIYTQRAADGASVEAAVAQAAHDVLVNLVPGTKNAQVSLLDKQLATTLSGLAAGGQSAESVAAGVVVGKAAAAAILAARANDHATPDVSSAGPANPGLGEWRPTPVPQTNGTFTFPKGINQQWGSVTPFVMKAVARYKPPAPPKLDRGSYRRSLAEVRQLGSASSPDRTTDQTHQARFWNQDPEIPVNQAARQLAEAVLFDLPSSARLFAELDTAVADARIATSAAKYKYALWRPVTALNADLAGQVTNNYNVWTPLVATASSPAYPNDSVAVAAAGVAIFRRHFDELQNLVLDTTTTGLSPTTRTIGFLGQYLKETADSRILAGNDFRFANTAGRNLGEKIAKAALKRFR